MLKWIHVFGEMNMHIWLCKDTGAMNRPLRLAECFVGISRNVRHVIGSPSAAVGADLSCPHIRKYTRNGEGKCIFSNGNMHFWLCKDMGTMNRPLRLAECFVGISRNVRHVIGSPSAAVGADLSCPHIRKYTRNGEGKCIFSNGNMHFW